MSYRIVIDTNVLISAVFHDRIPRKVMNSAKDKHAILLTSLEIANEVKRVLGYAKFKRYYENI